MLIWDPQGADIFQFQEWFILITGDNNTAFIIKNVNFENDLFFTHAYWPVRLYSISLNVDMKYKAMIYMNNKSMWSIHSCIMTKSPDLHLKFRRPFVLITVKSVLLQYHDNSNQQISHYMKLVRAMAQINSNTRGI